VCAARLRGGCARHPEEFGARLRVKHTVQARGKIEVHPGIHAKH
jgi:hypothetical protein